ncbi:hypothetical protein JTE90_020747 [Oedothorax gibbosus]|uniref:Uncharacterized protein n=1 Tax=Oedothorax gibbosus TaxID=931172 RepID=A0AAV6TIY2_9ARAC|nr:hypothetical protein JTE90_020747 [Oedothorax gibbosus]
MKLFHTPCTGADLFTPCPTCGGFAGVIIRPRTLTSRQKFWQTPLHTFFVPRRLEAIENCYARLVSGRMKNTITDTLVGLLGAKQNHMHSSDDRPLLETCGRTWRGVDARKKSKRT